MTKFRVLTKKEKQDLSEIYKDVVRRFALNNNDGESVDWEWFGEVGVNEFLDEADTYLQHVLKTNETDLWDVYWDDIKSIENSKEMERWKSELEKKIQSGQKLNGRKTRVPRDKSALKLDVRKMF